MWRCWRTSRTRREEWVTLEQSWHRLRPAFSSLAIDLWDRPDGLSALDVRLEVQQNYSHILGLFDRVLFVSNGNRSALPHSVRSSVAYRHHFAATFGGTDDDARRPSPSCTGRRCRASSLVWMPASLYLLGCRSTRSPTCLSVPRASGGRLKAQSSLLRVLASVPARRGSTTVRSAAAMGTVARGAARRRTPSLCSWCPVRRAS